jgi:tetratricopeptide (TPR) repeat protein
MTDNAGIQEAAVGGTAAGKRSFFAQLQRLPLFRWMDAHYNDLIVVAIAFATVVAALTAFLQSWASSQYGTYVRQGQALATETLGQDMRSRQREGYDFSLYTTWNEWDWRRSRATDPILAERASQVVDMIAPLTPLLDENGPYYVTTTRESDLTTYHADINVFTTTLLAEQRTFVTAQADAWNGKADGYVTVLTMLAVTLFLFGLSTTIKGNLRYLFAVVGSFLVVVALVQILHFTLNPVPEVPLTAIEAYARGRAQWYGGHTDEAKAAIDRALENYPNYGDAYKARGEILLDGGKYDDAAESYRKAITNGSDDVGTYWDMGWTLYLAGDYDGSLQASRHALELDSTLLPVRMNVATALLVKGDTDGAMKEYEAGLAMAADPTLALPASWSRLYLRETVNDLDRLINALDGQTGFYQIPNLDKVGDKTAVRAAAVQARQRIKEGVVSIEASGSPNPQETAAKLGSLSFGLYTGRRDDLLGQAGTFPRGVLSLVVALPYENLAPGTTLSRRVVRMQYSGTPEYLPTMGADVRWDGGDQGVLLQQMESPWPGQRGLLPGVYTVEYYGNGNLLQTGAFTVPDTTDFIVGPLAIGLESRSGGIVFGADSIFPAGVAKVKGVFNYSGLPDHTMVYAYWYRNGSLYSQDSSDRNSWGSEAFVIYDVPAGDWRLDLMVDNKVLQSAEFQVVPLEQYRLAVGLGLEDALFQRTLGDVYAYNGDYKEADIRYAKALELDSKCEVCYYRWWLTLYDQKRYQEAADKIQQAIDLSPDNYTYLCNLGKTYYQLGDEDKAKDSYRKAVAIAPAYTFNSWGNALYDLERYSEAVVKYQQSSEMAPDEAVYYANQGDAYNQMGQSDQAAAAYSEAVTVDPSYDAAYNKWGNLLYDQNQYADAAEKYKQAIAIRPGDAIYHANLGGAYREMEQYDLAAQEYQAAVNIDPSYVSAWNQWGNALYSLGQYADAADKYQQAIALSPDVPVYHYNLGMAYYQLGQYADARPEFQQAADLAGQQGDTSMQKDAEDMLARLP